MGDSPLLNGSQTEGGNVLIRRLKTFRPIVLKLLPLLSFIIPLIILYTLDPMSFEKTWKGRTYYLFFAWLLALEIILNWEELGTKKIMKIRSIRSIAFVAVLTVPTIYVILANFYGLNYMIQEFAAQNNVYSALYWPEVMPLSIEYLVFAALFVAIALLEYGFKGLKKFSISACFLGVIGAIYTIDNIYGRSFTPFQMLVPTTAMLAANFLNFMGYHTMWLGIVETSTPTFIAWDSQGRYSAPFSIGWPCSGIESLVIYSVTMLLFLKKSSFPLSHKIIYFAIGAVITYIINILRIATIFIISINRGDFMAFHDLYGQLYSISWIVSYPLVILGSHALLAKVRSWRLTQKDLSEKSRIVLKRY